MIISIHQPSYFPWLGLLDKIARSQIFVLLDKVQVNKDSMQYRNIFYCNGQQKHITLPVNYKLGTTFNELEFKNNIWITQHLVLLRNYYLKSPYFKEVMADIESEFSKYSGLKPIDILESSIQFCMDKLNVKSKIIRSSQIGFKSTKGTMVLEICSKVNANTYIAGKGSYDYMQENLPEFSQAGIKVEWQHFNHPVYNQHAKFDFVPGLSALDIFFFEGYIKAQQIFWTNVDAYPTLK